MATSFAPKDFGTGKWSGGPATISNPRFIYRPINTKEGPKVMTDFLLDYIDEEGGTHPARFNVGNAEICRIRQSAADDAPEAEEGVALSHVDPSKDYRISPNSEFGQFIAAIVIGGFSEAALSAGDVSVFDGVALSEVTPKGKDEKDRFPILLPTKVKSGAATPGKSAASGSKTASSTAKTASTSSTQSSGTGDAQQAAAQLIMETLSANNGGPITTQTVVKAAIAKFKGNALKAPVVGLLSDAAFLNAGEWTYDDEDKTIIA